MPSIDEIVKASMENLVNDVIPKIKEILEENLQDIIEQFNNSDMFVMNNLPVVLPEERYDPEQSRKHPLVIIPNNILEYNSKEGLKLIDICDDLLLKDFLIKKIEAVCIEKNFDVNYVVKGVVNYLTDTEYGILEHFNIDLDEFFDEE